MLCNTQQRVGVGRICTIEERTREIVYQKNKIPRWLYFYDLKKQPNSIKNWYFTTSWKEEQREGNDKVVMNPACHQNKEIERAKKKKLRAKICITLLVFLLLFLLMFTTWRTTGSFATRIKEKKTICGRLQKSLTVIVPMFTSGERHYNFRC